MPSDKQLKKDLEKDQSRLAELNKKYLDHEKILLENLYLSKKKLEKISEEKQFSFDKWKACVESADNTSTPLEPVEFKTIDGNGKKRSIKIGPKTSSHEVRKAVAMHDASKYDEKRKKKSADWDRNREEFGARMSDILKKKNRILGFRSHDHYFDSCFDNSASNSHTTPANAAHHTCFHQPSSYEKLEKELKELSMNYRSLESERNHLLQEKEVLANSLKSTQEHTRQIAENRHEHILTNRRYAEENQKLQRDLESAQKGPRRNSVARVTFEDDSDRLREEVESLSNSLAKVKNEREPHNILRDVGIENRLEFLQSSKASENPVHHHSQYNGLSSGLNTSLNFSNMRPGTGSSHRGNVRADAAMLSINDGYQAKFHRIFKEIYGVSVDEVKRGHSDKYAPQSKVTEIKNLRGTMAHRGCFTNHTPDSDADDQFLTLFDYCNGAFEEALNKSSTTLRAAQVFSVNSDVVNACERMRRICDIIVGTTRIDFHSRPPLMTGGLK
ncbi:hypothetical protein DSL72_007830 [Monilinia vaccinii-corymbosi]|uniref:Uncharacterized protein n=1 Tax=Monilinia vaccinii-corymbosi TaxID=61207 RepID=A0A8A3PI81_9HELO|nr:hypothetical protein DSL72_007830 [Monilinia vaccinii-corymbosi]